MTNEERIKRYATIVKWGIEFVDSVESWVRPEHAAFYDYDRALLEEYEKALAQLKEQSK